MTVQDEIRDLKKRIADLEAQSSALAGWAVTGDPCGPVARKVTPSGTICAGSLEWSFERRRLRIASSCDENIVWVECADLVGFLTLSGVIPR